MANFLNFQGKLETPALIELARTVFGDKGPQYLGTV